MGAEVAIGVLYAKEMKDPSKAQEIAQKSEEYKTEIMTPQIAARRGYISELIEPSETRARIVASLDVLENKTSLNIVPKKHGNIPL